MKSKKMTAWLAVGDDNYAGPLLCLRKPKEKSGVIFISDDEEPGENPTLKKLNLQRGIHKVEITVL
jgi:hypothetical protein